MNLNSKMSFLEKCMQLFVKKAGRYRRYLGKWMASEDGMESEKHQWSGFGGRDLLLLKLWRRDRIWRGGNEERGENEGNPCGGEWYKSGSKLCDCSFFFLFLTVESL